MTGRATFGEFARVATAHLDELPARFAAASSWQRGPVVPGAWVQQFCQSLRWMIVVLDRYVASAGAVFGGVTGVAPELLTPWPRACLEAREALRAAAGALGGVRMMAAGPGERPAPGGSPAEAVYAAIAAMAAGRDLLRTHLLPDRARTLESGSDWAPALVTTAVARALLVEASGWARQAARHGSQVAQATRPASGEMAVRLRGLRTACALLDAATVAIGTAQHLEPSRSEDLELLHAIPAGALEPRCLPGEAETINGLCEGSARSAERVRREARLAVPAATWSPLLTAESLSRAAGYATVISHHCEILQHALAARAAEHGQEELSARLTASAEAAGQARLAWLAANRGWRQIKADTDGAVPPVPLAPATAEAGDLALWTGRLAYAEPAWTLSLGPSRPARPPGDLAPEPEDLGRVLAAVHQAVMTLNVLAATDRAQVEAAGRAGRLAVPVSSLPHYYNVQRRFVRAPADRVRGLLAVYDEARVASAQAVREVAEIAADIRAPSRALVLARRAIDADNPAHLRGAVRRVAEPRDGVDQASDRPGPVERQLRHLGVRTPALLAHGRQLDQAGEQLMLDAARNPHLYHPAGARRQDGSPAEPARSSRAIRAANVRPSPEPVMTVGRHGRDREPDPLEAEP